MAKRKMETCRVRIRKQNDKKIVLSSRLKNVVFGSRPKTGNVSISRPKKKKSCLDFKTKKVLRSRLKTLGNFRSNKGFLSNMAGNEIS